MHDSTGSKNLLRKTRLGATAELASVTPPRVGLTARGGAERNRAHAWTRTRTHALTRIARVLFSGCCNIARRHAAHTMLPRATTETATAKLASASPNSIVWLNKPG